jgi:hypothetical protein
VAGPRVLVVLGAAVLIGLAMTAAVAWWLLSG